MRIKTTGSDPRTFSRHWNDADKAKRNLFQIGGKNDLPFQQGSLPPWAKGHANDGRAPQHRPQWAGRKWEDPVPSSPVEMVQENPSDGGPVGEIIRGKKIDGGRDGTVWEAMDSDTPPKEFAVKEIPDEGKRKTEVDTLKRLPAHRSLVKFYEERDNSVILERLHGKPLGQHIAENKVAGVWKPVESVMRTVVINQGLRDMAEGAEVLHNSNIAHGDLTKGNVHLGIDRQSRLVDFAKSKGLDGRSSSDDRGQMLELIGKATAPLPKVFPLRGADGKPLNLSTALTQAKQQLMSARLPLNSKTDFFQDIPSFILEQEIEEKIRSAEQEPVDEKTIEAISVVFEKNHSVLSYNSFSFESIWEALQIGLDLLPTLPSTSKHIAEIAGEITRAIGHFNINGTASRFDKKGFAERLDEFLARDRNYLAPIPETGIPHPDERGPVGFTPDEVDAITLHRQQQNKRIAISATDLRIGNLLHAFGTQYGASTDPVLAPKMKALQQKRIDLAKEVGIESPDNRLQRDIQDFLAFARSTWLPGVEKGLAQFEKKSPIERPEEAWVNPGTLKLGALQESGALHDPRKLTPKDIKGMEKAWRILQEKGKSDKKERRAIAKKAEEVAEKSGKHLERIDADVAQAWCYLDQLPLSDIGEKDSNKFSELHRDLSHLFDIGTRFIGLQRDWGRGASINTGRPKKEEWQKFFVDAQRFNISGRFRKS